MKLRTEEYLNNASVPFGKVEPIYDVVDNYFKSHDIDDVDYLNLVIDIRSEKDLVVVHGIKGNEFSVELFSSANAFQESLISERIEILKSIILCGVKKFLETTGRPSSYVEQLEAMLNGI